MRNTFVVSYAFVTAVGLHQTLVVGHIWLGLTYVALGVIGIGLMVWPMK
jgi:hypothetical protein